MDHSVKETKNENRRPEKLTESEPSPFESPALTPLLTSADILRLQRSIGNQAVMRLLADNKLYRKTASTNGMPVLQRDPAPSGASPSASAASSSSSAAQSGDMSFENFTHTVKLRFGVDAVRAGTFEEQARVVGNPPGFTTDVWHEWTPGATSPVYRQIVDAFDEFAQSIGGIPPVKEIVFFETYYESDTTAQTGVIAHNDVGANFGAGHLNIFKASTTGKFPIPMGRSGTPPIGPTPTVALSTQGSAGGAILPNPSERENMLRVITHELGHGLAEAAHSLDPQVFEKYRQAAGWTKGSTPQLFDAGVPAVQTALSNDTTPPPQYEITRDNWNNPRWVEQPISVYMLVNLAEDFAEAVKTYINARDVLSARAQRRFNFLDSNKKAWQPALLRAAPLGSFPTPSADTKLA